MAFALKAYLLLYFFAIALFYLNSNGFVKRYNQYYPYWKVLPVSLLGTLVFFDGAGLGFPARFLLSFGLLFGAIGDWLIALSPEGIVTGAVAFGIGHILYLLSFATTVRTVFWQLGLAVLAWGAVINHFCLMPMFVKHPLPVLTLIGYSLLLSAALLLSASIVVYGSKRGDKSWNIGGALRAAGFFLFYVSDSCLILNETGFHVPKAELSILSTYFGAQFLILWGSAALHEERRVAQD